MFDLERQLLCFVLHESLFLPALRTSLYHHSSATNGDNSNSSSHNTSNGNNRLLLGSATEGVTAGNYSVTTRRTGESIANGGVEAGTDATAVAVSLPTPSRLALTGTSAATATQHETTANPSTAIIARKAASSRVTNTGRTVEKESKSGKEGGQQPDNATAAGANSPAVASDTTPSWPPHGTWCTPGEGAGTGAGPGGTGCGGKTSSKAVPLPPLIPSGLGGLAMTGLGGGAGGATEDVPGGQALARAAATGVVQWEWGGEGAVTDTMALLDCSLRR